MNRRGFLKLASAAAVGALAFDPERALWVPGQRTYFDVTTRGLSVGDVVTFKGREYIYLRGYSPFYTKDGSMFVRSSQVSRLTPESTGMIGVVEVAGAEPTIRLSGPCQINPEDYHTLLGRAPAAPRIEQPTVDAAGRFSALTMEAYIDRPFIGDF